MSQLSKILRDTEDNGLMFWCPACDMAHRIRHGAGAGPRWGWNGNVDKPTFTPSILLRGVRLTDIGNAQIEEWRAAGMPARNGEQFDNTPSVCHSFVTDGRIQFLSDCTHALAGQTVDLPSWPLEDE